MRAKPPRALVAALSTAAVMATSAMLAAPASAATPSGDVYSSMGNVVVAVSGGPGKVYPVFTHEAGNLTNVTMTFDFSSIAGIATPSFPEPGSNCTITGTAGTCLLPDRAGGPDDEGAVGFIPLKLVPAAGAVDGVTAKIKTKISATGATAVSRVVPVSVADGPDLVVAGGSDVVVSDGYGLVTKIHAKPDTDVMFPFTFTNLGSQQATGLSGYFLFGHGFVPQAYDNCTYIAMDFIGGTAMRCTFGDTLDVNAAYTFNIKGHMAADAASGEFGFGAVNPEHDDTEDPIDNFRAKGFGQHAEPLPKPRSGEKLTLKPAATPSVTQNDIDSSDNSTSVEWIVATSHDAVAIGAELTGAVGDSVTADLGFRNNGPASLSRVTSDGPMATWLIKVPSYAAVTKAYPGCESINAPTDQNTGVFGKPGYPYYRCSDYMDSYQPVGGSVTATFTFKIKADHGNDGSVTLESKTAATDGDSNASNNTAAITLKADDQPSLPTTGSKTGIIAGSGAALVLLGGVLLYAGRRRRRQSAAI